MLSSRIQADIENALKEQKKELLDALRYLISHIKNAEIDKHKDLEDFEVVDIIRKQVKQLTQSLELFRSAGRKELVDQHEKQIAWYKKYLPIEITDNELLLEIKNLFENNKDKMVQNNKQLIGLSMSHLKEKASPERIMKHVTEFLKSIS